MMAIELTFANQNTTEECGEIKVIIFCNTITDTLKDWENKSGADLMGDKRDFEARGKAVEDLPFPEGLGFSP